MNVLIIYTHPNHESLNYSFLQSTLKGLNKNASVTSIEIADLYAEGFNPVLSFDQNNRRRDMATVPELESYREQLRKADKLIFIYPVWWGRSPAMLQGYFDRVFATGFAYEYTNTLTRHIGLLKGKDAVCISTMKGPSLYPFFLLNNSNKVLMKKALLGFVGIKKVKFFEFGDMESKKGTQKKRLLQIEKFFETFA